MGPAAEELDDTALRQEIELLAELLEKVADSPEPLCQAEIDRAEGRSLPLQGIERFAFYDAARRAFAVVQVGDPRPYGCFLLRKGVIAGDMP